jgi:hypothetical protein
MTQLKRLLSSVASAFVLRVSQFISIVIQFALSQKIKILFRFLMNMLNLGFINIAKHFSYLTELVSNEMQHARCAFIEVHYCLTRETCSQNEVSFKSAEKTKFKNHRFQGHGFESASMLKG